MRLGDLVETITTYTGIKWIVKKIWGEDCGCLERKEKLNIQKVQLEQIKDLQSDIIYDNTYEKVEKELNRLYWYDRKVFEIITSGESIASLSRKTTIQYYSLYNTFKKVKEKIKKIL